MSDFAKFMEFINYDKAEVERLWKLQGTPLDQIKESDRELLMAANMAGFFDVKPEFDLPETDPDDLEDCGCGEGKDCPQYG
jgi:hypothetical protein